MPSLRRGLQAMLALGAAGCALALASGPTTARTPPADGAGLVQVLPTGGQVLSGPHLPAVNGLTAGMGGIWLTGGTPTRSHLLYLVDQVTGRIGAIIALPPAWSSTPATWRPAQVRSGWPTG